MRELTKSIASFSWAMSLFGLRQMTNLMTAQDGSGSLEAVRQATTNQLANGWKTAFEIGDRFQRGMVDLAFGALSLGASPDRWSRAAREATGAVEGVPSSLQETGWGPMPARDAPADGPGTGALGWGPVPR